MNMESLKTLYISESGIRKLPSSIANLTGLEGFSAGYCENLTFGDTVNLTFGDFLLPLDCWFKLRELDLSGNNFVVLPRCISKFVNLRTLYCRGCKSLLEIPEQVLPPRINWVYMDNCTSLEKIPKLSWVLLDNCSLERLQSAYSKHLRLVNCVRLRGYDITENIFLNLVSVSSPPSDFDIYLSGDEVPKLFSCRKEATLVGNGIICEVSFEIPPNLKWETLRLVLCVVNTPATATIVVNGNYVNSEFIPYDYEYAKEGHVVLSCIPLIHSSALAERRTWSLEQGIMCQVTFECYRQEATTVKKACGLHLLGHQVADVSETSGTQWLADLMAVDEDDMKLEDIHDVQHQDYELLSRPLSSKTSLGKRPRRLDFMALDDDRRANVVDIGDHEVQWLTLSTGQADHPKRRHIDHNEDPEQ